MIQASTTQGWRSRIGRKGETSTNLIRVDGIGRLKPALRLITDYHLMIQEVRVAVVTSYTSWLECVQVKRDTEPKVYVGFSPRFEQIWLESRKRRAEYIEQKRPMPLLAR